MTEGRYVQRLFRARSFIDNQERACPISLEEKEEDEELKEGSADTQRACTKVS